MRQGLLLTLIGLWAVAATAAERHSDPDGCFSCHGLPGLEYFDKQGLRRVATILKSDYYASLHGSVPCKDCHRKIEQYPHKPEEGYVDCGESCHVEEPSKGKPFSHRPVVDEFKTSAHGKGHAPGATRDFHGGNRVREAEKEQNPSCRRCHSNTPYIPESQIGRFKEAFQHTDTECGTCHQGEVWRKQFGGHILRRLVGKNYSKAEANALCVDCHNDSEAMKKVELQDYQTKVKEPAAFRFQHATQSYDKTLHGRLLVVGVEDGADCIDCHAPKGFRHGIQRDEEKTSPTHPDNLPKTCAQEGCHGYARAGMNEGFVRTDVHAVDQLRLDALPSVWTFLKPDSPWKGAFWILAPLALFFALASVRWALVARGASPVPAVGNDHFQRVMLALKKRAPARWWTRFKLSRPPAVAEEDPQSAAVAPQDAGEASMTVLYASQTGNGEGLAHALVEQAEAAGFTVRLLDMTEYEPADIVRERLLFLICSTHGEGEPPAAAAQLHAFLYSEDAPRLEQLRFGVLALGDSSYKHFCKAGKDFDAFLIRSGAERVLARVDADADFELPAARWMGEVLATYARIFAVPYTPVPFHLEAIPQASSGKTSWGKTHPYPARVRVNVNLNGPGSAKETRHLEIEFGDSGLVYEAGDALGIYPKNSPVYVEVFLDALGMAPYSEVTLGKETLTLREALYSRLDITALSHMMLEKYLTLVRGEPPEELVTALDDEHFGAFAWGRQLLDLVRLYPPTGVAPQTFVETLRRMPPRLYSIASSMKAVGSEVHLTVGVVRYHSHGSDREGVCSTMLGARLGQGERLPVFVQLNKHFRPPADPGAPMIMVGPGTGIAPFRAFVQEREATGAPGRNWLFFGDQKQAVDFLYAEEWRSRLASGVLTRLDLAFSRDQAEKIYVQTRMLENARELYAWLQDGGHFYVCGDASRMAKDVHAALCTVIEQQGGMSREKAEEYLQKMADTGRYQRDVY